MSTWTLTHAPPSPTSSTTATGVVTLGGGSGASTSGSGHEVHALRCPSVSVTWILKRHVSPRATVPYQTPAYASPMASVQVAPASFDSCSSRALDTEVVVLGPLGDDAHGRPILLVGHEREP